MPPTARIAILIFLSALMGTARAQTFANAPASGSQVEEFNQRPDWAKQCPEPTSNPVRVAPPLPCSDGRVTPANYEQLQPAVNNPDGEIQTGGGPAASKPGAGENKQAIPLSPLQRKPRIELTPPAQTGPADSLKKPTGLPSIATLFGSLGAVLGVFLLIAWLVRRAAPQGLTRLPSEAFEVLGRAPIAGRQNVHLLRCGNKLLLVSVTPAGTETLTEIDDPEEVDRLAGLCRQAGAHSSTAAFRQIFEQMAPKRPSRSSLFSQGDHADYDPSGIELSDAMSWEQGNV